MATFDLILTGGTVHLPSGPAQTSTPGLNGLGALNQGFLEGSNVSSPQEMVRLSETVRHFESMQRIVQGYDESLEKSIRKLGEF